MLLVVLQLRKNHLVLSQPKHPVPKHSIIHRCAIPRSILSITGGWGTCHTEVNDLMIDCLLAFVGLDFEILEGATKYQKPVEEIRVEENVPTT